MVSMVRLVWEISRVEREFKRLLGYRKFWIRSEGLQWSEMERRDFTRANEKFNVSRFLASSKFANGWRVVNLLRRRAIANCRLGAKFRWWVKKRKMHPMKLCWASLRNFKAHMRMQMFRKTRRKWRISDKVKERRANAIKRKNRIINFKRNCSMSKVPSDRIICPVV